MVGFGWQLSVCLQDVCEHKLLVSGEACTMLMLPFDAYFYLRCVCVPGIETVRFQVRLGHGDVPQSRLGGDPGVS